MFNQGSQLSSAPLQLHWSLPIHADAVTQWHAATLVCVQGKPAPDPVPANRGGPVGLLDIALVQAAVHDPVQAVQGRFEAYQYENPALLGVCSPDAAAAAASPAASPGFSSSTSAGDELDFSMPSGAAGLTVNPRQYQGSTELLLGLPERRTVATDD